MDKIALVALFQVAFNFCRMNQVQLAIDVEVNDFSKILTVQIGTSETQTTRRSTEKKLNRVITVTNA